MKKIYLAIATAIGIVAPYFNSNAQCAGNRYHDFVFPSNPTLTSNIQYGSNLKFNGQNQNLLLDVYEPTGDTSTSRALVIMAHGGSFIGGSKTGSDVVSLCKDLAKLGYVVASIEYRVGMTNFPVPGPDSSDATEAVMRAVHDGRAAVRYFRKNAAIGGNTYKIDVNNIYFAGVSAGGFIALQLAYLDDIAEFPTYIDTLGQSGLGGGVEGLSGNPGYSSDVNAIVNICGAIGDTAWMKAGDEPVLNFHGTNDGTVPYGSAVITLAGLFPIMPVDGSFSVNAKADELGLINCFEIHEGQDHVPHTTSAAYYDTTLTITRNFLEHFTCGVPLNCSYTTAPAVGINEITVNVEDVDLYPNPASSSFMVDLVAFGNATVTIEMFDVLGKNVGSFNGVKTNKFNINRNDLPAGVYFVRITSGNTALTKKVILE
ncbi:MAG: T9SS type A sorting domain-containing protein [Bacteroidia bacterium]|nr:T9SS type A sorting domain-containing protein [Bacteroidia bacterium]